MSKQSFLVAVGAVSLVLGLSLALAPRLFAADEKPAAKSDTRVFELRTYTAAPGKFEALHARFRDHTNAIFKKHGMEVVGYWVPIDGEKSKNTLVYILAFPSKEAKEKAWKEFQADPEWKKAREESEKDGKLLDHAPESVLMSPTDYSPMK